jgi:hypothetical protein
MRNLMFWTRRKLFVAGLALVASALGGGAIALAQPPATIMLIRHAEKPASGMDLSPAGFERAKVIPQLFGGSAAPHNLPRPDFLFATHVSKNSNRPVETITPLSEALKLPISHEIDDKDFATLAKELLSGKYAGKVVLVAWHHGSIPGFAKALGAVPPYDPWPETQFDRVWRIDYAGGKATLTDLPQGLMAGDSK